MPSLSFPSNPSVWLIAGATASGKSALALSLAEAHNGVVINSDSMQLYAGLPILSAQPDTPETVPHVLYGYVDAAVRSSVTAWREDATRAITAAFEAGQQPIVVGGTGFYLRVLLEGLSPMPDIQPEQAAAWLSAQQETPVAALRTRLLECDPVLAARLYPADRQRHLRGLMVFELTGVPLSVWQEKPGVGLGYPAWRVLLDIPKERLNAQIIARTDAMLERGVLEEVSAFRRHGLSEDHPVTKTLGYKPLCAHLDGTLSLSGAREFLINTTRQYAKRQRTWFRHQYRADCVLEKVQV
jgi:tRNA dimethylallyltransferase